MAIIDQTLLLNR